MDVLTTSDIEYLSTQSSDKLNLILTGMTSLMEDTQSKATLMENQPWYKRMANTITGKNKMTVEDISRNHEKINVYMSEAISELYNRNCIDQRIILGLGNKLNELYASQIELKQMLGAFVNKLNQKIISVDNFHMLTTEIDQGVYSNDVPIVAICKIMSQIDVRTIQDQRKMDILLRAVQENNIVTNEERYFIDFLTELIGMSDADAGIVAMTLNNLQDNYLAQITQEVVCSYYFLPDNVRKMKNKKSVAESILNENQIDTEYKISLNEFYEELMGSISQNIVQCAIEEEKSKFEEKRNLISDYLKASKDFISCMKDSKDTWNPEYGEFYTEEGKEKWYNFLHNVVECLNPGSPIANNMKTNSLNITGFIQKINDMYGDEIDAITYSEDYENEYKMKIDYNGNLITYFSDENETLPPFSTYIEKDFLSYFRDYEVFQSDGESDYDRLSKEYIFNLQENPGIWNHKEIWNDSRYWDYYVSLEIDIMDMIEDDPEKLEAIYNLIERYPVEFDEDRYDSIFWYGFDYSKPYITVTGKDMFGREKNLYM